MTSDEQRLLDTLLKQLTAIKTAAKDPDAQRLIEEAGRQQPDALYLLVQKTLLQEQAIESLRAQVSSLEQQVAASGSAPVSGGFLERNPWGGASRASAGFPAPGGYSPVPQMAPASPFGGFLGSAAATAAGVAGGAFLFHGIESLLHHPQGSDLHAAGYDGGQGPESVTINHYHEGNEPASSMGSGDSLPVSDSEEWNTFDDDDGGSLDV